MTDIKSIAEKQAKKEQRRKMAVANMEKVISFPSGSPKRWRAAFEAFLIQRPEALTICNEIADYNDLRRQEVGPLASTELGRLTMSAPEFLMPVIQSTDPEYFMQLRQKEVLRPSHLRKLKEAFPEFFIPEVI